MDNLINKISSISNTLKSKEIIDYLSQWNIDKLSLLKLVIESKIGFDQLSTDADNHNYFKEIEESPIYETANYSQLILVISTLGDVTVSNIQNNNLLNKFYLFHKMLYRTANLVSNLLLNHTGINTQEQVTGTNSIVNPLFNSQQPDSSSNSSANPYNKENIAETDNDNYSVPLIVTGSVNKENTKMFLVKEELISSTSTSDENTNGLIDKDVTLGTFLKSLSGI